MPSEPDFGRLRRQRPKPAIWSEGQQTPRFEIGAFLAASTTNARRLAARGLATATDGARRAAAALRDGTWRLPPERLGHTGRYLPDHQAVASTFAGAARFIAAAGRWAAGHTMNEVPAPQHAEDLPPETTPEDPTPPARVPLLLTRSMRSRTAAAPRIDIDSQTLEAIRSVVHAANVAPSRPVRPAPAAPPVPEEPAGPRSARLPPLAPAEPTPLGPLSAAAIAALGALAMAAVWPAGAVQAILAHLRGEDLREAG